MFPGTDGEGCTVLNNAKYLCQHRPGFWHSLLSLLLYWLCWQCFRGWKCCFLLSFCPFTCSPGEVGFICSSVISSDLIFKEVLALLDPPEKAEAKISTGARRPLSQFNTISAHLGLCSQWCPGGKCTWWICTTASSPSSPDTLFGHKQLGQLCPDTQPACPQKWSIANVQQRVGRWSKETVVLPQNISNLPLDCVSPRGKSLVFSSHRWILFH